MAQKKRRGNGYLDVGLTCAERDFYCLHLFTLSLHFHASLAHAKGAENLRKYIFCCGFACDLSQIAKCIVKPN